jgi:hypothetical protein
MQYHVLGGTHLPLVVDDWRSCQGILTEYIAFIMPCHSKDVTETNKRRFKLEACNFDQQEMQNAGDCFS